ncbi:AAA-domain-containing protein [Macrolepiota fuliginosa MF-IS2]|uniref:AAA-domain-containing protein n=1 Tax=Macrolepiota fuliginosa MF-IS2 TaxID=1400762 RepID=A0A9P5XKP6_9AGAR|nr:AAA-domain-containing protein [Macrolepiota fuliginosa MF-IS2]
MPSSLILRGSRSLLRSKNSLSLRHGRLPSLAASRKRLLSSTTPDPSTDPPTPPESPASTEATAEVVESTEETDKPRARRARVTTPIPKDLEPVEIPEGLNILWSPADEDFDLNGSQAALPPPEVFEDALHNLHITLHPQTQHRATYASAAGLPIEPTLGLYCPIEGGDYIIDATVRELARRTGAEVLVLDAVQLAAGEWGHFGKAANSLQLPRNPLHFPSPTGRQSSNRREDTDEEDAFGLPMFSQPQQMTLTLMAPPMQGRPLMAPSPRRASAPPSKIKVFFDALVNTPSTREGSSSPVTSERPRLIYVRDFPTLAASSDIWYPPLLSAVRSRRRGPISRPSSAVSSPMTIIFGMTPPLVPTAVSTPPPESGLMSVLVSRNSAQPSLSSAKPAKVDWGEDEAAEKAREKRLREKLKKWEKSDTGLHSEFSVLSSGNEPEEEARSSKSDIILIGGPSSAMSSFPPMFGPQMLTTQASKSPPHDSKSSFFRSSVLVPTVRSPVHEKSTRIARRREINELTMRMGVGAIGGEVEESSLASTLSPEDEEQPVESQATEGDEPNVSRSDHERMWDEWGNKVEVWSDVRRIADRVVGNIMSARSKSDKTSLESTIVPWSTVEKAWASHKASSNLRKQWLKDASPGRGMREEDQDEDEDDEGQARSADEVVERLKNDGELDDHEERLLSCIVNPVTMPTSFNQVHLPAHTVDSVRTIVSLPLLHPHAFKQGILKEHSMTGCLLFGPPGTGKTLVVRALAKEAGCRMLAVSPSDVMDMYVGEGEKLVRAVFSLARKLSPCVIFLDEIDALFGARMSTRESGGAFAHRGVITEFMQEMDGLKTSRDDSVIIIGATNRPFDLDDAVLRRLPRRLLVDLPGEKERQEILKILLRDEVLATDVDVSRLAEQTESFSGSDLKHLCVSAALDAVKENVQLPWVTVTSSLASQTEPTVPSSSAPASHQEARDRNAEQASEQVSSSSTQPETSGITKPTAAATQVNTAEPEPAVPNVSEQPRVLRLRNFTKALKEITPSSSESLGSLAELRKWNEEFGEGRQDRKRQQVWGRGRFGFVEHPKDNDKAEGGKVVSTTLSRPKSKILEMLDMQ